MTNPLHRGGFCKKYFTSVYPYSLLLVLYSKLYKVQKIAIISKKAIKSATKKRSIHHIFLSCRSHLVLNRSSNSGLPNNSKSHS